MQDWPNLQFGNALQGVTLVDEPVDAIEGVGCKNSQVSPSLQDG